jgi:SAM-dependent methyltransferase
MTREVYAESINHHYGRTGLTATLAERLLSAGKQLDALTIEELAPVDQFHTRGLAATMELAQLAQLQPGQRVLDVGGGLGGSARTLATRFGCDVTVLDLTDEYCRAGEWLTTLTGLSSLVHFQPGNALDLPFAEGEFDVVWSQHSSMNIDDKERLYAEMNRVLKPGRRLAIHELMAGTVQPVHFPVPWAHEPALSFLRPAEELRTTIRQAGFEELVWADRSQESLDWFRPRTAAAGASPPPLGLHLLLGDLFAPAFRNQVQNLAEDRVRIVQAIYARL